MDTNVAAGIDGCIAAQASAMNPIRRVARQRVKAHRSQAIGRTTK